MQLTLEDDTIIAEPTKESLDASLRTLRIPGCTFAVLDAQADFYMQTARNDDGSFVLEYQEGKLDQHYEVPYFVDIEDVIEAFSSFLAMDNKWREKFEWKKVEITPS